MQLQTVTVTPELADMWLKQNGKNRPVSMAHVKRLADEMRNGQWVFNGQTISFDESGRLLDGQHRLKAVVVSGCEVPMAVAMGVSDPRAFTSYDAVVRKRDAAQIAGMIGVTQSSRKASAARIVMSWESSATREEFRKTFSKKESVPPHIVAEVAESISDEYDHMERTIGKRFASLVGCHSKLIALLIILNRIDPIATNSFCHKVKTGVMSSETDPCLAYRDRMMSGRGDQAEGAWALMVAGLTFKAWNYHRRGKPLKTLRWRTKMPAAEPMPLPEGGGKA